MTADSRRPRRPQAPPDGLSRWARGVWRTLLEQSDFSEHELLTFRRALVWWDRSDQWLAESETATGRERALLVKQSLDAATSALRHWKTLRFVDPAKPTRRPGRPGGDAWSQKRREGATAHLRALGLP